MSRVAPAIAARVRACAQHRCEYCHMRPEWVPAGFQIDHIIAQKHSGDSLEENLAFACLRCNARKGPNVAGVDPVNGEIIRLFPSEARPLAGSFRMARCLAIREDRHRPHHDPSPWHQ